MTSLLIAAWGDCSYPPIHCAHYCNSPSVYYVHQITNKNISSLVCASWLQGRHVTAMTQFLQVSKLIDVVENKMYYPTWLGLVFAHPSKLAQEELWSALPSEKGAITSSSNFTSHRWEGLAVSHGSNPPLYGITTTLLRICSYSEIQWNNRHLCHF